MLAVLVLRRGIHLGVDSQPLLSLLTFPEVFLDPVGELSPPQTQTNLHSPFTRSALGAPRVLSSIFLAEESLLCVPVFLPDMLLVRRRPCPPEQSTASAGGGKYQGRARQCPILHCAGAFAGTGTGGITCAVTSHFCSLGHTCRIWCSLSSLKVLHL